MFQAKYDQLVRNGVSVAELHATIREDADVLAAGADDLGQRSLVYHQVYRDSGMLFHFPLVASHGALWATWYLFAAWLAANVFAVVDFTCRLSRRERMATYTGYIRAIKEINRQVMIEAYTSLYLYKCFGERACAELKFSERLAVQFRERFGAGASGFVRTGDGDRDFYETFFRWEQQKVVGPAVDQALAAFEWPLMKALSRRPWVWFSYFRIGRALIFRDFADKEERVAKGLAAFDWAAAKGWDMIERNCRRNPFLPRRLKSAPAMETARHRPPALRPKPAEAQSGG
jgi:hypothetical protein